MLPELALEEPMDLVDELFVMLDQISSVLSEEGARGVNGGVMEEL